MREGEARIEGAETRKGAILVRIEEASGAGYA